MIAWMLALAHAAPTSSTWVLEEELLVQVRPPLPVGWADGRTVTRWRVRWTPGEPEMTVELCGFWFDPVLGAQTRWPPAALAAVPALTRPVSFDGARFEAGPVVESVGAGDDDGDGHPGITVEVAHPRMGAGEVYVRQTSAMAWSGTLQPDGTIAGRVRYEPVQEQLGASTWWLRMGLAQRPHKKRTSTFRLVPVADGTACPKEGG